MESQNDQQEKQISQNEDSFDNSLLINAVVDIGKGCQSIIGANVNYLKAQKSENDDSSDEDFYDSAIRMQESTSRLMDTTMKLMVENQKFKSEVNQLKKLNSTLKAELEAKNEEINQLKRIIEEQQLLIHNQSQQS